MAKLGAPEQGGYDPFNAISESLSSLVEPPEAPAAQPKPPAAAPRAKNKTRTIRPPAQPVVVETPRPEPEDTEEPESGGGVAQRITPPVPKSKTVSSASQLQITKRFKTTRREAAELDAASIQLGAALGVSVDFSKVTRALWDIYLRHQEDILRNVPDDETWERPANNDAVGLAALDERLADLINDGLMVACRRPKNSR